ncbi:hypothetical protein WME90_07795 [Sorangium sp. So ce375]|uniref:hypothetical protein n=1 Tax=Sorangium sp. So ce375 TaxID=3133306 RepID=UPI003F5C5316
MKTDSIVTASTLRRLACATSALLLGALSTGCIAGPGSDAGDEETVGYAADALSGYYQWIRRTTTNTAGYDMGLTSAGTCVLSGVAGKLDMGFQWYTSDRESRAAVERSGGHNWLFAYGGAYHSNSAPYHLYNPVLAQATCFPDTTNVQLGTWEASTSSTTLAAPVKIADLDPNHLRQCFLSEIRSVQEAFDQITEFGRVKEYTTTDTWHPTTGWYLEGSLYASSWDSSTPNLGATCIDFPSGSVITTGYVGTLGDTVTETITSGTGIKACGLTHVGGTFTDYDWDDGVFIDMPATLDGQWTMTVMTGKGGHWACVK